MKFILFLLVFVLTKSEVCTKIQNCDFRKCPNTTVPLSHIIAPTIFPFHEEFTTNMEKAVEIIKKLPGYRTSNNKYTFHMTIHYLCCYTPQQLNEIAKIVSELKWRPLSLKFKEIICNNESMYAILDQETDDKMKRFVLNIENEMRRKGIPVHSPRSSQQPVSQID